MSEINEKIKQFYGKDALDILESPSSIEVYTVDPKKNKDASVPTLNVYKITGKSEQALSAKDTKDLQSVLFDINTYDFEHAKRGGFFFPEIGIKAVKADKNVVLLFDFFRDELLFSFNGQEKKTNFDGGRDKIIAVLKSNLGDKFKINQTK